MGIEKTGVLWYYWGVIYVKKKSRIGIKTVYLFIIFLLLTVSIFVFSDSQLFKVKIALLYSVSFYMSTLPCSLQAVEINVIYVIRWV